MKFEYSPQYLKTSQSRMLNDDFLDWLDNKGFEYREVNLILDGGNFVFNGKDTAIITKRILEDNPDYTKREIISKLKEELHLNNIILINEELGDVLGHADGQVHFIQSNILLMSDFIGKEEVKKQIKKTSPSIEIVEIPSSYTEENQYDEEIPSAKGLYVNILETADVLYLPQYGLKNDQRVYDIVRQYTDKKIQLVNMDKISTMGGSINCLTWYCPEYLLPD
ncbi:hypothetical protein RD055328_12970 [Companilactobacillus sp. RD055328]|nr:hypothetical protein RD055328_12970 [Companilactobacillus sp. RD055328]